MCEAWLRSEILAKMEGSKSTHLESEEVGDLRSDAAAADDLPSPEIKIKAFRVKFEKEPVDWPSLTGNGIGCLDEQISVTAIKQEPMLSSDGLHEHHSISESDTATERKLKEYICESFDKIDSQIDDDGWIRDEPGQDLNVCGHCGEKGQDGPICTTSTTSSSTGSTTASKRPLSDDIMNHDELQGSAKILNLGNFRHAEGVNNGQWLYQINKKRKHGIDLQVVTTSSSEEPGLRDSNVASDPSLSVNSIGQIGSMSPSAHPQESGRDDSLGGDIDPKSSDMSKNLPDVIPDQSQQKYKSILEWLDQVVKMADEATLAQTGVTPSGYILKSFTHSPTKEDMVTNQERDDPGEKQEPRPSSRARILRRNQPKAKPKPKPTVQPENRTFLALIPVGPSQPTPIVIPILETLKSTSDEKSKTDDLEVDKNKRVTRSQVKDEPPKPNQAELQEANAQDKPILNPLSPEPSFRRIAPKPNPQDPTFPKPQLPAPIFVPIFELVPVELPVSGILLENPTTPTTTERPSKPKTSSARRKQVVQTRGVKWRQEESEMLIHESQEDDEEQDLLSSSSSSVLSDQEEVIHLISDDEEEEVWEVVKMEYDTDTDKTTSILKTARLEFSESC